MTGHHPWDELMRKHYTAEERKQMLENARRELEEEERGSQASAEIEENKGREAVGATA